MSDVQIVDLPNGRLGAVTPYHKGFVAAAKQIGGRWAPAAKQWTFDARDRERLAEVLRKVFGTDGSPAPEGEALVTVRVSLADCEVNRSEGAYAQFCGRRIAHRPGRDADVQLAEGVVLVAGRLQGSGGSTKYPEIEASREVMVEIRDLPASALQAAGRVSYELVGGLAEMDQEQLEGEVIERLSAVRRQLDELAIGDQARWELADFAAAQVMMGRLGEVLQAWDKRFRDAE